MLSVVLFDIMIFFVISSCLYNLLYVLSSILTYFIIFGHLWTYCVIYFEKNGSHLKKFEIFWCARGQIQIETVWSFYAPKITFMTVDFDDFDE